MGQRAGHGLRVTRQPLPRMLTVDGAGGSLHRGPRSAERPASAGTFPSAGAPVRAQSPVRIPRGLASGSGPELTLRGTQGGGTEEGWPQGDPRASAPSPPAMCKSQGLSQVEGSPKRKEWSEGHRRGPQRLDPAPARRTQLLPAGGGRDFWDPQFPHLENGENPAPRGCSQSCTDPPHPPQAIHPVR